jgi:hypothetical protein
LDNKLVNGAKNFIHKELREISFDKREKHFINILQDRQKPKLNKRQIDRYFALRKFNGVDLDKDEVPESELNYHANLKPKKKKKRKDKFLN